MVCFRRSLLLLLVLALVSMGHAQTATTSVRGVVADRTGAVIAGADVVLTEKTVGFTQAHKTNSSGEYSFQQIPPGSYQIKISVENFKEQTTQLQLLVNQPATLNVTLLLGSSETTVEVSAQSTALNATDATIGTPFSQAEIQVIMCFPCSHCKLVFYRLEINRRQRWMRTAAQAR